MKQKIDIKNAKKRTKNFIQKSNKNTYLWPSSQWKVPKFTIAPPT